MADAGTSGTRTSCDCTTLNTDYNDSTPPQPVSPTIAESPIIHSQSLPAVIPNSALMWSILQSFRLSSLSRSLNRFLPSTGTDHRRAQMASQASEGAHTAPSHILAPILGDLQKLKALTPKSLPPYNLNFDIKSHAQVLKERLLPIGKFIADYLDGVSEAKRGILELRICRYIADEYWPLPIDDFTYLKIQEKYRNALYKMNQRISSGPAVGLPPLDDTSSGHASPEGLPPETAAYEGAPPTDSSLNSPLITSPTIFGKDTLSQNAITISAEAATSAEKRDLNK
ncbi:hypothetical protein G6011_03088 [Alternaria panax]|uniref:Chromodomain-helicase-DNA-binding protein 1-like C-terminal domain-containing protein n=1 Tax=Alternaria panax TaxID=48097 RepID=A0AAD4IE72_9PLEO|nr:hypothetical protein G6011_03088 [Alternaria panax]